MGDMHDDGNPHLRSTGECLDSEVLMENRIMLHRQIRAARTSPSTIRVPRRPRSIWRPADRGELPRREHAPVARCRRRSARSAQQSVLMEP